MVTHHKILEAEVLPPDSLAQETELRILTCAISLGRGRRVNIYTNSKYAFSALHVNRATWMERNVDIRRKRHEAGSRDFKVSRSSSHQSSIPDIKNQTVSFLKEIRSDHASK